MNNGGGIFSEAELRHKMSKKIAQLTKVIFHLNTRNEDSQLELNAAHIAHKRTIEQITQDASQKISNLKESLVQSEQTLNSYEKQLRALKDRHENEKKDAFQEFYRYKDAVQKQKKEIQKAFKNEVISLSNDLENMKSGFQERIEKIKNNVEILKSKDSVSKEEIDHLNEKHSEEIEDLVKESNQKYNKMLTEQLNLQDNLEKSLRSESLKEVEQLKKDFNKKMKTLMEDAEKSKLDMKKEFKKEIEKKDNEGLSHLSAVKQDLVSKIEKLLTDLEENRALEEGLRAEKEKLKTEISSLVSKNCKVEEFLKEEKSKNELLQRQILDKEECDLKNSKKQTQLISTLKQELLLKEDKLQEKLIQLEAAHNLSQKIEKELLDSQLKHAENSTSLSETLKANQDEIEHLRDEKKKLEKTLQEFERSLCIKEEDFKKSMDAVQKKLFVLNNQVGNSNEALLECSLKEKALQDKIKQLEDKIVVLMEEHKKALDENSEEFSRKQKRDIQDLENRLSSSYNESKDNLIHEHQEQIKKINDEKEKLLNSLKSAKSTSKEELLEANKSIDSLNIDLRKLERELEKSKELEAKNVEKIEKLKEELGKLNVQLKEASKKHKLAAESIRKEWKDKHAADEIELKAKLKRDLLNSEEKNKQTLIDQRKYLNDMHQKEKDELLSNCKELENELLQTHSSLKEFQSEFQLKIEEQRAQFENSKVELEALHLGVIQKVKNENLKTIEDIMASNEKSIAELKISFSNEKESIISSLKADEKAAIEKIEDTFRYEQEKSELERKKEVEYLKTQSELAQKHEALEAEKRQIKSLSDLKEKLNTEKLLEISKITEEFKETKQILETKKRGLEADIHNLKVVLDTSKKENDCLQSKNSTLGEQLLQSKHQFEEKCKEMETSCRKIKDESEQEKALIESKNKNDLENLLEEHITETQVLNAQFETTKELLMQQVNRLKEMVESWQGKYEARESRQEDLALIDKLQSDVCERDALVKQTLEDMAYFKRELLNREENYNKTFSRSPNVGLLQVLKPTNSAGNGDQPQHRKMVMRPPPGSRRKPQGFIPSKDKNKALPPLSTNNNNNSYRDLRGQL